MSRALEIARRLGTDGERLHGGGEVDWSAEPAALDYLATTLRPGWSTLETGTGASTIVFAAADTQHVAVSPAPDEHERIHARCVQLGVPTRGLRFVVGTSDEVLPGLDLRELDLFFIDGAHSFPHPIVDFHHGARHLLPGGLLLLDDVFIPSVGILRRFLDEDPRWRRRELIGDRTIAYERTHVAEPAGDFWRAQPINASWPDYSHLPLDRRIGLGARVHGGRLLRPIRRVLRRTNRR